MRRFFVLLAIGSLLALPAQAEQEAGEAAAQPADAEGSAEKQPRDAAARRKGGKSPEERTAAFRARLLEDIELSDEQERRIDAIERTQTESLKKQQEKVAGLRDQMKEARKAGDTESIRKYSAELREARKDSPSRSAWISEVREVLDPDQQQQFDANRDKMQSESKRRRSSQQQGKRKKKEAAE
jgi:hypothetical protein